MVDELRNPHATNRNGLKTERSVPMNSNACNKYPSDNGTLQKFAAS
jgi:hypothetical protein